MKKNLFLSIGLLASFVLMSCNNPSQSEEDLVIEGATTPSGQTYSFEDVDPKEHGNLISISSKEDLINFREKVNSKVDGYVNAYVELKADIKLSDEWIPINGFKGQFNGNNHSITNIKINTTSIKKGFFSYIEDAKIGCLNLQGYIAAKDNSGILCGYTIGKCTIVGVNVEGKISSTSNVGGLVGQMSSGSLKVVGCLNKARVYGNGFVGGLVGINNTYKINISDSANYGVVKANGAYVGGIISMLSNSTSVENDYNLYKCYNCGTVKGQSYIGGVVGLSCSQLISCGVSKDAKTIRVDESGETEVKNTVAFEAPYCSSVCGALIRNIINNANGELIECENVDGFAVTGINNPAGCTRVIKFKDKIMLFAATNKYAVSEDGGHTFGNFTVISDKPNELCPINGQEPNDTGNTHPYVLDDGRIVIMYRAITRATNFTYGCLRMRISDTNGVFNPSDEPITLIENYTTETGTTGAFYEPYPIKLEDGSLAVYISEDVHFTNNYYKGYEGKEEDEIPDGLEPTIPALDEELVCIGGSQDTVMIPLRIAPGAKTIGEGQIEIGRPQLIFRGSNTSMFGHENSRPGMTVLTRLHDNSWAMILENSTEQKDPGYNLVVQITYSRDGLTWTVPKTIIRPHQEAGSSNGIGKLYKTCAPFITTLPDGRIVVTCATDEDYEGYFPDDDAHYKHEIAFLSKDRVSYGDDLERDRDFIQLGNYVYNPNEYCVWASVAFIDGVIYVSGLEGVNYLKPDGKVGSPTCWILLSTIHYQKLYQRLGLTELN